MKAGDLYAITRLAKYDPSILNHLVMIYGMGYKQGQIDTMKSEYYGINYSSEVIAAN